MYKTNSLTNYLTKITHVHDQQGAVSQTVTNVQLVRVALNGFTKLTLHSLKAYVLERSFWNLTYCWMIASHRRLIERLWEARKRMVMRTLHFPVVKRRERGRS
jgi:hypothetical protein